MAQNDKGKLTIFQRIDKFGDLFFLNILFVVSCIPIVTAGAAITAVYAYTTKLVRDEETTLWRGYWKAFRSNFKDATKAWLVVLVIAFIMFVEFEYSFALTGLPLAIDIGIMALEALFLTFTLPLLFPLISRYENTTANMFKNAFILNVSNLGTWFYLFFLWAIPISLFVLEKKILYYAWYLWLLILVSVIAYASSFVIVKLFDKIESRDEDKAAKPADTEDEPEQSSEEKSDQTSD